MSISIQCLTYNVHRCQWASPGELADVILRTIPRERGERLCSLQEVLRDDSSLDQVAEIAAAADFAHFKFFEAIQLPDGRSYGLGILSDIPLASVEKIPLAEDFQYIQEEKRTPGFQPWMNERRILAIAHLTIAGRPFCFMATHLGLLAREREAQRASILKYVERMDPSTELILAGDFNIGMSFRHFDKGMKDDQNPDLGAVSNELEQLKKEGWRVNSESIDTYPLGLEVSPSYPLDSILYREFSGLDMLSCLSDTGALSGGRFCSDHRAVFSLLRIKEKAE